MMTLRQFVGSLIPAERRTARQLIEFNGRTYRVTGSVKRPCGHPVPVIDTQWMSDIKWQRDGYEDRLRRPEVYRDNLGEDVPQMLARLRVWLLENDPEAEQWLASASSKRGRSTRKTWVLRRVVPKTVPKRWKSVIDT